MTAFLPFLGVVCAAVSVCLVVWAINRRERWAKWSAVGVVTAGIGVGAYATAYTRVVHARLPDGWTRFGTAAYLGCCRIELVADYKVLDPVKPYFAGQGQSFWGKVFAPANWVDRRIRREKWVIEPRDDWWPSRIAGPGLLEANNSAP